MRMLKNNVLVTQAEREEKTESGIFLGEVKESGVKPAVILATGPAVVDVNVGDTVYLHWGKGMAVKIEGNDAAIISEEFIEAVIDS